MPIMNTRYHSNPFKLHRGLLLGPGAFLGMPVLLCAGKSKKEASWPAAPEGDDHEQPAAVRAGDEKGCSSPSSSGFAGAICPFTITAKEVCVREREERQCQAE